MSSATATVGRMGHVEPDPSALARYRAVFPERFVVWNAERQLHEIRQHNPVTGQEERVELVFWWTAPPHPDGRARTEEEIAAMVAGRDPALDRLYRPFDHQFVGERLQQWHEFQRLGARGLSTKVHAANQRLEASRRRAVASEMAAGFGELRRWLGVLADASEYRTAGEALAAKPAIAPGVAMTPAGLIIPR